MDDLSLIFLLVAVALLGLGVFLFVSRKRQSGKEADSNYTGTGLYDDETVVVPSAKKVIESPPLQQMPQTPKQSVESLIAKVSESVKEKEEATQTVMPAVAVVEKVEVILPQEEKSSAKADLLTEYEIYLQFGYLDKAAKTLSNYLALESDPPIHLQKKLLELYLKSERIDDYADLLEMLYKGKKIGKDILQVTTIAGLKVDRNNLNLRLLAQSELDWGPEEVLLQLGAQSKELIAATEKANKLSMPRRRATDMLDSEEIPKEAKLLLLNGYARLVEKLDVEEREAIKGFMPPRERARLFMIDGDYVNASLAFETALTEEKRPLTLLVDLLRLDFIGKNMESFIRHYYQLRLKIGTQGELLKRQLLDMGLKLGSHQFFVDVELANNRSELEAIASRFQLNAEEKQYNKFSVAHKPLVAYAAQSAQTESIAVSQIQSAHLDAERSVSAQQVSHSILAEAETQLEYGQIEEALVTLEQALYENPQDIQLYPRLLDLYERLEDKPRFAAFSQKIREKDISLPEEINLAMSHLEQRLH